MTADSSESLYRCPRMTSPMIAEIKPTGTRAQTREMMTRSRELHSMAL